MYTGRSSKRTKMGNRGSSNAGKETATPRREFFSQHFKTPEERKARSSSVNGSFVGKNASRHDVLVVKSEFDPKGMGNFLASIQTHCSQGKGSISAKMFSGEPEMRVLAFPGYRVATMHPRVMWSRMRNYEAETWRSKTLEGADSFIFLVTIPDSTEKYLEGKRTSQGWERDRFELAQLLRKPQLIENPTKPLLLLVQSSDDELDLERISTLLGVERLGRRPLRAIQYDEHDELGGGVLKDALEWLVKSASSQEDESTAAVTGFDTEDEASAAGSTTTTETFASSANLGHYILDYQPTLLGGNPTLQRFEPIKKGTHCPFARAAKLWGGKSPDEHTPRLASRVDRMKDAALANAGPLAEFAARAVNGEALDGFCLEIPDVYWPSVEKLGERVRELLTELAKLDPTPGENAIESMGPIESPQWRFRFAGEDFFLTTFSPVYKEDSSRYAFGVQHSFILLQPRTSFGRHGLTEDTPASATNWDNPTSMRDKARVAFKENGCPYHIPEELPYPIAEHVVKPAKDDGTNVVRWWEEPLAKE